MAIVLWNRPCSTGVTEYAKTLADNKPLVVIMSLSESRSFWAPPYYERDYYLKNYSSSVVFARVNTDEHPDEAAKLGLRDTVPGFACFNKDGKIVDRYSSSDPVGLKGFLEKASKMRD